jgi:N-acetylglucosaminyldiphosphoundecaprenol N-acetyl-beta-D-mannosaminyltransferase
MLVGDVTLHPLTFRETVDWIANRAVAGPGAVVCTPNADYVVRAHRDRGWRAILQAADLRVPDGMAVVYAARIAGRPMRGTVTGRLLLPAIAERAATEGWEIALFGAGPGVAQAATVELRRRYPGLRIGAAITPSMGFVVGSPEDAEALRVIRETEARVVFVALGAPKQEAWMVAAAASLPDRVLVGVGAAFDIVSGRFREAPRWMTRWGLEWLFRLAQEPGRLARRYLVDDPWIFWWAAAARLSRRPGNRGA